MPRRNGTAGDRRVPPGSSRRGGADRAVATAGGRVKPVPRRLWPTPRPSRSIVGTEAGYRSPGSAVQICSTRDYASLLLQSGRPHESIPARVGTVYANAWAVRHFPPQLQELRMTSLPTRPFSDDVLLYFSHEHVAYEVEMFLTRKSASIVPWRESASVRGEGGAGAG